MKKLAAISFLALLFIGEVNATKFGEERIGAITHTSSQELVDIPSQSGSCRSPRWVSGANTPTADGEKKEKLPAQEVKEKLKEVKSNDNSLVSFGLGATLSSLIVLVLSKITS